GGRSEQHRPRDARGPLARFARHGRRVGVASRASRTRRCRGASAGVAARTDPEPARGSPKAARLTRPALLDGDVARLRLPRGATLLREVVRLRYVTEREHLDDVAVLRLAPRRERRGRRRFARAAAALEIEPARLRASGAVPAALEIEPARLAGT